MITMAALLAAIPQLPTVGVPGAGFLVLGVGAAMAAVFAILLAVIWGRGFAG